MSQKSQLREHLKKHGSITRLVAFNIYKIIDLRRRIADLRQEGMSIETVTKTDDTGYKYTEYQLKQLQVAPRAASHDYAGSTHQFAA